MAWERERRAAIAAVEMASRLCADVQLRLVGSITLAKGDKSPVTVADFGAQAIVNHHLGMLFPHDPIIGEEDAAELRKPENAALTAKVLAAIREIIPTMSEQSALSAIDRGNSMGGREGRYWTLDPVDGTKGFLRHGQYAVALSLIQDGEVQLGVLGCPNLALDRGNGAGSIFVATKGGGAAQIVLDDRSEWPIRVDNVEDPALARFCESVESGHTAQDESAVVAADLGIVFPPVRMDSQCKYGVVARGGASIYLRLPTRKDYVERIWDHAAGALVVTEAGGRVTDVRGKPLDFGCGRGLEANSGVVATNGRFHDRVLAAVAGALGE